MRNLFLAVVVLANVAVAEVVEKTPTGFSVRIVTTVSGTPAKVYDAIVGVGSWWDKSHTYSGSSKNLSINAKAGGCFCEKLPPRGELQHMMVVYADPGKMLRMTGALGPMQSAGIAGALTFELAPEGSGDTKVTVTYNAGGFMPGGIENIAEPANGMIGGQVNALKEYLARK
jgi:uncharacterized protein YndB with AHSA1/START domain